jgi:hypothetical protein
MGPPQLQSGGVDTWFAAALDAAKAIMAGESSGLVQPSQMYCHSAVAVPSSAVAELLRCTVRPTV